jgi:hypothetical protein
VCVAARAQLTPRPKDSSSALDREGLISGLMGDLAPNGSEIEEEPRPAAPNRDVLDAGLSIDHHRRLDIDANLRAVREFDTCDRPAEGLDFVAHDLLQPAQLQTNYQPDQRIPLSTPSPVTF